VMPYDHRSWSMFWIIAYGTGAPILSLAHC
jgi:hypothetical protein